MFTDRETGAARVLVVEDDNLVRLNLTLAMTDAGFDVVEAATADDALVVLTQSPDIRVVVTDIEMPGTLDGIKLAKLVRDRWPPVHLIVVSAHRAPGVSDLPENVRFFAKPYDSLEIVTAVHKFVGGETQ